jgi:hypothetical protein
MEGMLEAIGMAFATTGHKERKGIVFVCLVILRGQTDRSSCHKRTLSRDDAVEKCRRLGSDWD